MFKLIKFEKILKIMSFFIFFIFSFNISFSVCSVANLDSTCKIVDSSFVYLNLDGLSSKDILDFGGKLCYKDYSDICIDLVKDNNGLVLKNKIPLGIGGIYEAKVWVKDKYSNKVFKSKEIFVENKFLAPLIISDINLKDTSNQIIGRCISGLKVIGENKITKTKNFETLCVDGNFNEQININDLVVESFYYKNNGRAVSSKVDRVIYPSSFEEDYSKVNSLNIGDLVSLNYDSLFNKDGKYFSISREVIIGGTSSDTKGVVYVNGKKAFLVNGKFYSQIQLNEGENIIEVINSNGDVLDSKIIYFLKQGKFSFTNLKVPKIINGNSLRIFGDVNFDSSFNVYVNGEFYSKIKTNDKQFDFTINNLNEKRNVITFKSKFGIWNKVVYVDSKKPEIEILGPLYQKHPYKINFKVEEDLGINYSSISIKIGDKIFEGDAVSIFNDYLSVDISDFGEGNYPGEISLGDMAGNKVSKTFNVEINSAETLIENLIFQNSNSKFVGRVLFLDKKDNQNLILVPSRFIAFKSIYLDGKRVDSYEIKKNGDVYINLNLSDINENGTFDFHFINKDHIEFKESFKYFARSNNVSAIDLNFISWNNDGGILKAIIYGKVNSDIFDWEALKEIENLNYKRFGDYIEIYTSIDNINNLDFFTFDLFGNQLKDFVFDVSKLDNNKLNIVLDENGAFGSSIVFENYDNNLGIRMNSDKFFDDFSSRVFNNLGMSQIDDSGYLLYNFQYGAFNNFNNEKSGFIKSDISKPKIYFEKNGSLNKLYLDGTFNNVQILNLTLGGEEFNSYNDCGEFKKFGACISFDNPEDKEIYILVRDDSGLELSKIINPVNSNNFDLSRYNVNFKKTYFVGNDYLVTDKPYYLRGKYLANGKLTSVTLDSKNCNFDENNFICEVENLNEGLNNLTVNLNFDDGEEVEDSLEVNYISQSNFTINDLKLEGDKIILTNDGYYLVGDSAYFNVDYINEGIYDLFIGGEKIDSGEVRSKIDIDFTSQILNKNEDQFDLEFVAYDKYTGEQRFYEKFEIFYTRVINTFVKVFLE